MSSLSDAMAALSHPTHGSNGVALHKGREKMGHGHAINHGYHASTNNNSDGHEHDNNDHNRGDDEKDNHRHTPHVTNNW